MTRNEADKKLTRLRTLMSLVAAFLCLPAIGRYVVSVFGPLPIVPTVVITIASIIVLYAIVNAAVTELVLFLDGKKSETVVDPDGNANQPTA